MSAPNSIRIAGLLGPTLLAIAATEWANIDVFLAAFGPAYGPHVYLNGTLLFIAGLALVRAHNVWVRAWPVLITLVGWFALLVGLGRMAAPVSAQAAGGNPFVLYSSFVTLLVVGAILSYKAYIPGAK
ncbi:MAG: hypothetical protein U0002_05520 [Thermoanaerobaculia bacterium]